MEYGPQEKVEVSVDGIWFPATVLNWMPENMYMVQYLVRKEGGEDVLQRTKFGTQHIRPTPPQPKSKPHFSLFNRFEAYHNRAWTSGIIREIKDKKFTISLKCANKEMTFIESNLRPCMEWVDDKWIDASEPNVADNDASQSSPSKISNLQNPGQEVKTPTSTACQTDIAAPQRYNISSSKTKSRSQDKKVPKAADTSYSRPQRKSKVENVAEIATSTDCKSNEMKRKTPGIQNPSGEPVVVHNDTAALKSCSLDDKLKETAKGTQFCSEDKVEVSLEKGDSCSTWFPATVIKQLSGNSYLVKYCCREDGSSASLQKSTVNVSHIRPPPPAHKSTRRYGLSDKVDAVHDFAWTSGLIVKELDDEKFTVFFEQTNNQMTFSKYQLRPHMEWVDGKWIDAPKPMVVDNDASHSRPSKKSKMVNATEITASTDRRSDAAKTKSKQYASENLKTPTSSVSQTEHQSRSLNEKVLTASVARPSKKSKVENAADITTNTDCCETDAVKTRSQSKQNASQEPKTPTSIVHKAAVIALKSPINPSLENGSCNLDDKVTTGKKDSGKINKTTEPIKRRGRPPKTPHSSRADNKSKPSSRTAEETYGEQSNTEQFVTLANDAMGSPRDNVPFQSHTSTSVQTGQINDPPRLVIECLMNRQREHTESSTHPTCAGVSLGETVVQSVANDSSPIWPFTKTVGLWDRIESMEVFQSFPQKPHFRPLERSSENTREGLAVAHMLTFCKIANKISELGVDMEKGDMEKSLKDLEALEDNGFNVEYHRNHLNALIVTKEKLDHLQKVLKEYEQSAMVFQNKKAELEKVVDELKKQSTEIEAKRKEALSKNEIKDAEIAVTQSSLDRIFNHIKTMQSDLSA